MTLVATIDYTDAAQMRADYAARRARLYAPRVEMREPSPVKEPEAKAKAPRPPVKRRLGVFAKPAPPEPAPIVRDAIHDWLELASPHIMKATLSARIMEIVAEATGVTKLDLISHRRTIKVVRPRQICFYLMRQCTVMSLPEIGRRFSGRDHTTVLHGTRKIAELMETDADLRGLVEGLTSRVQAEAA